jgi:NAD-dependent SIR2 family protein deacetylase
MSDEAIEQAARALGEATALLVTAGAGMGVDSGLPDFRGTEGFWNAYPAYRHLGLRFEQLANPTWFKRDPALAWGFYGHRRNLYRATQPHAGFAVLKRWGASMRDGVFVFTSNVDGQFQSAGFEDARVVECHGSLLYDQCTDECGLGIAPAGNEPIDVDPIAFRAREPLPRCRCGALLRPNVLMFGDAEWDSRRTDEQEARLSAWLTDLQRSPSARLVVIECGAGTGVPTVRMFGEQMIRALGASLVRVNVREPQVPAGGIGVAAGANAALAAIAARRNRT